GRENPWMNLCERMHLPSPLGNLKMESADGHRREIFSELTPAIAARQIPWPTCGEPDPTMADASDNPTPEPIRLADELLPEVYAELRRLAASLTGKLQPGQTLQPTALVHEAYLRLVRNRDPGWEGRRHFFGAAAKAMREILIEQARR